MSCEAWLQKSAAVMRGSRGGVGVVRTPSPPWKMKIMKIYQVYIVKLSQICLGPPLANTIIHPRKLFLDPRMARTKV